jgi:hypothetical protein
MPIASVAIKYFILSYLKLNLIACCYLVSGGKAPYITEQ